MSDPRTVILRHLLTEKGTRLREKENKFFFEVTAGANKMEIKRAVETLFKVNVTGVNTQIVRGKTRRYGFRQRTGTRPNWKKAIVKLKSGQTIEALEQV